MSTRNTLVEQETKSIYKQYHEHIYLQAYSYNE
jgi:hypothetical protein